MKNWDPRIGTRNSKLGTRIGKSLGPKTTKLGPDSILSLHFYPFETFCLKFKNSKIHLTTTLSLLGISDRKISKLEFYRYFYQFWGVVPLICDLPRFFQKILGARDAETLFIYFFKSKKFKISKIKV